MSTLTENMRHPPSRAALQQLANGVAPAFLEATGVAVYGDSGLIASGEGTAPLGADLRRRVTADQRLVYQRVVQRRLALPGGGHPVLLRREGSPSGVEVYLISSLARRRRRPGGAGRRRAQRRRARVCCCAVLFALVAAGGVLRPVRDLDRAARRLGAGELDTRLKATGRDELARLVQTFNATAAALETSVGNARRFVADVSHELRTPLASILAMADVIEEEAGRLDGDLPEAARLLNLEVGRLVKLVEDLMEISRFDAGARRTRRRRRGHRARRWRRACVPAAGPPTSPWT